MSMITKEKIFEWQLAAIRLLQANGGRYHSRDIVRDLEKRLDLTPSKESQR